MGLGGKHPPNMEFARSLPLVSLKYTISFSEIVACGTQLAPTRNTLCPSSILFLVSPLFAIDLLWLPSQGQSGSFTEFTD